ncbi:MAG: cytochrome c [Deltaproteobacteria bacterium]|nr:cytochrome c [Deltaproteobacteria bacterium]
MTRDSARNIFVGGTLVVSVIFLVMTYLSHASYPERTHPENLTEEVVWGKHVWEKHACINCHTLLGEGAYYAPELGNVIARRGVEGTRFILETSAKQGWGQTRKMPQFDLSEKDITGLVEFFIWMGNVDTNNWPPNIEG